MKKLAICRTVTILCGLLVISTYSKPDMINDHEAVGYYLNLTQQQLISATACCLIHSNLVKLYLSAGD